jgi:hypothetical protein
MLQGSVMPACLQVSISYIVCTRYFTQEQCRFIHARRVLCAVARSYQTCRHETVDAKGMRLVDILRSEENGCPRRFIATRVKYS